MDPEETYGVWTCAACLNPITGPATLDATGDVPVTSRIQPQNVWVPSYGEDVPDRVADDAREAHTCLSIGAWRAAAAMARRSIQSAAYNKECPRRIRLVVEQIDWLENKRLITPLMKDVAHQIRLGGNLGAHPDSDGLKDVDEEDAHELVRFMDDFIAFLYQIPARLEQAKERSAEKEQPNAE